MWQFRIGQVILTQTQEVAQQKVCIMAPVQVCTWCKHSSHSMVRKTVSTTMTRASRECTIRRKCLVTSGSEGVLEVAVSRGQRVYAVLGEHLAHLGTGGVGDEPLGLQH